MAVDTHPVPMTAPDIMGPLAHRAFAMVIFATAALALAYAHDLLGRMSLDSAFPITAGLLVGVLAADLLTGMIHWACDTWGSEETPIFGASLIYSFREHHRDPKAMLNHDWVEVNGHAALLAASAFAVLIFGHMRFAIQPPAFLQACLWSMICFSTITNQLHYWAHMVRPPRAVRALQQSHIVIARGHHADHHRAPHTSGYCITTGWLNPTLDAIHFWRVLERMITIATRIEARSIGTGAVTVESLQEKK